VESLQTKIRHLEKQRTEDQDLITELSSAKDERDRYKAIIEKLQTKYQTLHQDAADLKAQLQQSTSDNDKLSRGREEHETDLEMALLDREMAEERAEQAESELEAVRAKLEERDMELEIMREEAALFTTELSEEDKEAAGWYRLQHENERLRQALGILKEMSEEKDRDNKARFAELETDVSSLDAIRQEHADLQDQVHKDESIIEHLRAQVDASAEWEDLSNELTDKIHDLEEKVKTQEATIRELESEAELNNELLVVHMDEEEDLHAELDAKDTEIAEHIQRLALQEVTIADNQTLISKFRDLVFDFQGRLADAESSRNMTEAQVRDTTGRFNQVMDLNRRLRASNVEATGRRITSELRQLRADQATQKLAILTETGSPEFLNSMPLHAYFTAKSISAKATLTATLLLSTDRELSYNGGLDEATSRLFCVQAVQDLAIIRAGSEQLTSSMEASVLSDFATFGPTHQELVAVEKALDDALAALMADEVKFADIASSLERTKKVQEAVLMDQHKHLSSLPEDESTAHIQNIVARLDYLGSNFAVVTTMLSFLANNATELLTKHAAHNINPEDVASAAQGVLELFAGPSVLCGKAVASGKKLLRTVQGLREDSLYPHVFRGSEDILEQEAFLSKLAREAAEWGRNTLNIISASFQPEASPSWSELNLEGMFGFYWSTELKRLEVTAQRLDAWTEDATLLLNTSEIAHGPTPWSQKAKEMEAAQKKNSEASVLLENLKADHKATLLSLHERERVIETKSLEIEHLDAKYREATNKVTDAQQLQDKLQQAEQEAMDLRNHIHDQSAKIEVLEQQVADSDRSDHAAILPDATRTVVEPAEQTSGSRPLPVQVNCLLAALQTENHWLRRREHADMFDRNLKHIFGLREARPNTRAYYGDRVLEGALLDEDEEDLEVPASKPGASQIKDTTQLPDMPSNDSKLCQDEKDDAAARATTLRPKMSPLGLETVQTAWRASAESPEWLFAYLETNLRGPDEILARIPKGDEDLLELWESESSVFESLSGEMDY
jgi:dynactin 1